MKKIVFILALVCLNVANAQDNYSDFWSALLNNNREEANKIFKTKKNTDDVKSLIIQNILNYQKGVYKEDNAFFKNFVTKPNYENYLYALWNEPYMFTAYLETGLNDKIKNRLEVISSADSKSTTIDDALAYLNGISARHSNDLKAYTETMANMKAFKNWQYCGVFENLNKSGLDRVYEPETKAKSTTPFNAESNGYVNWYTASHTEEPYQFFTNHEEYGSGVHYAQTFITAEQEEEVILRIGNGSAFKLWLNDVLIYENIEDVITDLNAYQVKVKIPKGTNRLLIKNAESGYGSYFIVTPFNLDGTHNTTLKDTAEYSDYNKSTLSSINPKVIENEFETFFKAKVKENPNDFFYAYCLMNTYFRSAKHEEAKLVLEPYLKQHPKSSLLRQLQIKINNYASDYTTIDELNKNIELDDPTHHYPIVLKATDYEKLSRMTIEELKAFLKTLKDATDVKLIHILGDFVYNARQEDRAKLKKNIDDVIKEADGNTSIILKFVPFYGTLFEDEDKTIKLFENYSKDHWSYTLESQLASYYDKRNNKKQSLNIIKENIAYFDSNMSYLKRIVRKLHDYQEYEASLEYIEQGLASFPYSFIFYEYKGDALLQIGKKQEAIKAYEKSLEHNSNYKSLRKKIRDLKNETNILTSLVNEEAYDYIQKERGIITDNNYGFNILLDNIAIELYGEGGGQYRNVFVYEITSNNGIEQFKEYNLGLSGSYNITKSEIVKADKSIVPADKSGSNLVFNGLAIGDVIYLDYESSFSNSGRFYKDYTDNFMMESFHPTIASSLKIITPKGFKLGHKSTNGELKPTITDKGNYTLYQWSLNNYPGKEQGEDYMPEYVDELNYIHISTIKDWNEISVWYSDLVRSRMEYDSTVEKAFNSVFPEGYKSLSEDERAKAIYNYMMANFTYSYVSFRQSGFVPQKPAKTIKTNLGDCKDFSTVFVTLAQKAELKSNLVLILTADYGKESLVLPSTDFNHCIAKVMIDGKEQFLELTDKYLPYKSLPMSLRGATALEIPINFNQTNNFELFKLNDVSREKAIIKSNVTLDVKDNQMKMAVDSELTGHTNSYYASIFAEPNAEVVKKSLYDDFDSRIEEDFTLDNISNIKREDNDRVISYTSDITINKKTNKIGKTYILQLPIIVTPYTSPIVSLEKRVYPIDYIKYETMDAYYADYDIKLESNQKFTEIPENIDLSFKKHSYKLTYTLEKDNHLKVTIEANPSLNTIAPEDYLEFKNFVKQILEAEEAFIGYTSI